ncbi:Hypothetical predicted protein [Cloeon dipterum]|uniref:Uncharacterized protein n=1 Tax=Cloeon dipterum TaxID=197152 RepID=A0A8S1CS94_9INSE|nr:Hypothetical predicted protein [Cloeon dipterum]
MISTFISLRAQLVRVKKTLLWCHTDDTTFSVVAWRRASACFSDSHHELSEAECHPASPGTPPSKQTSSLCL